MTAAVPLPIPKTLTFYALIQQSSSSMYFSMTAGASGMNFGTGFYATRDDAEKQRTLSILSDKTGAIFHIFEMEFPNPAYKE